MSASILVIGGTGMLGLPVARKLKEEGFSVSILTTNIERARQKLGDEFELKEGDVRNIDSLKKAMNKTQAVYLNLNSKLDPVLYAEIEIAGTANAALAARESGVARIGMISGASSEGEEKGIIYLDAKVKAERSLMSCGVPYTIMRPSFFFEALPHFIQGDRAVVLGRQPIPRSWLAASDYARQVARAFQSDEAGNKCFYNLGPQKMGITEVVQKYCARHYPAITPQTVSFAKASLLAALPGQSSLRAAIGFFKYFEKQPEDGSPAEADRMLGPNLTTLEEWSDSHIPED